jgi:hypothetical protein
MADAENKACRISAAEGCRLFVEPALQPQRVESGMSTKYDLGANLQRLAGHFQGNLPRGKAIFTCPIARAEMLLLPSSVSEGHREHSSAAWMPG